MKLHASYLITACLLSVLFLSGCQYGESTSPVETIVETESYSTETPIPECVVLPDIKISIVFLSESSIQLRVVGLKPNEPVYTILSSTFEDKKISTSCCDGEFADANGVYDYSVGLRDENAGLEYTEWKVWVVHSRGATCTEFSFP